MPANIASTIDPYLKIINLSEYIYLKEVRSNTSLIGGKIIYNGKVWPKDVYALVYPEPVLEYDIKNADSTAIGK